MRDLRTRIASLGRKRRVRRRFLALVCLLGLVVAATTSALMRLPAFTQKKPTFCGLEEHQHTEVCQENSCALVEHVHDLSCYSNPNADVETEADWLCTLPADAAEALPDQLVAIARTQLGYRASEHNYQVRADGTVAGYTRYGAWENNPYEDWNVAFASFCLEHAGIGTDVMPRGTNAQGWQDALVQAGQYEDHAASPYFPRNGDLAFVACDDGRTMVGIVEQADEGAGTFGAIVGDWGGAVCELSFDARDAALLGFGRLPAAVRPASDSAEVTDDTQTTSDTQTTKTVPTSEGETSAAGTSNDATEPAAKPVVLTADVGDMHVKVEATLPADATYQLVATTVAPTDAQIDQIERSQEKELAGGIHRRAHVGDDLLLLDLRIQDEQGNEVEPQTEAHVVVSRAKAPDALVHFAEDGAECLEARKGKDGFSFATEGFSVFAFAFTVDFWYEGYEYHLPGGSEISLSQLLRELRLDGVVTGEVASVSFSDPSLVEVQRRGDDWVLRSLVAFDSQETLIVTMANGNVYVVDVTDAKSYYFQMNVNDSTGGCVYERSTVYGPSVVEAVTDAGVALSGVRPRSADNPTNGNQSCTPGYHFIGWRINGYEDYGMGATGDGVARGNLYSIQPSIAEAMVGERWHTFTACFVPDDQYMVTFDQWVWADEQGRVNGTVQQGSAMSYTYLDDQRVNHDVYFCYSGSAAGALAVPNYDSKFIGWYQVGTENLICSSASFVAPADLSQDIMVQARFVKAAPCNVRYYSYNSKGGAPVGYITVTGSDWTGQDVSEQVYEDHNPSGATAWDYNGYTFVAWRDEQNHILTRDHELKNLPAVTQNVAYKAEYLAINTSRVLITAEALGAGRILQGSADLTDQWVGWGALAQTGYYITLNNPVTAVPNDGYRFDHWEFNGARLSNTSDTVSYIDQPLSSNHIQELTAVFVPVCTVTYDLRVIQQVGNNSADFQHWESVPWCSKDVSINSPATLTILGEDLYSQTLDNGATLVLPDLVHNNPADDATIRVSQTNNAYNLLTHTFKGWRVQGGDGTIYPAGTAVPVWGPVTYEAVWDAYLPGKRGYYGLANRADRMNTNTCGFFVRLFDTTFDIGNTATYTDCLFTSRIFLGGESQFATDDNVSGIRMDFFGYSNASTRDEIDTIDSQLRAHANTSIPYSEEFSGQSNGPAYPGSTITFEQPFPSDEFMFARIRAWNAAVSADRKIQINGTAIPQEHLTTDYFDLRWYVLKDQENSWHVDGMLIPKYAKLVVTKRFDGSQAAIDAIKSGNFYIGVTRDQDKTQNTSLSEEYKLRLHWHTDQDSNDDLGYYISENGTYTWVIDTLEPLTSYWVAEHYYTAQSPYATARSIHVSNTTQSVVDVGDSNVVEMEKVYSYPDNATIADIQTVSFTNRYTQPREIALVKQDATSRGPIADARFTFTLYVESDGQTVELPLSFTTDDSGMYVISVPSEVWYENKRYPVPNGSYRFKIEEEPREGYVALPGSITGTVELSDVQISHVTLDDSVTSNPSLSALVELGEVNDSARRPFVNILNEPRTTNIQVSKNWTNGATTPVTMQLLRNGVAVTGKSVQLSPANNWTASWESLPTYVNGNAVTYTVREEWIGEPGGEESVHYNASADTDGYEDYIVSQSQTVTATGDVSVYVENTPNSGQVVFSKVDDSQRAVAGAEFTVYVDPSCRVPITAAAFVSDPGKQRPSVFVSDEQGMVTIEGLNPGTYYMKETLAPTGYVMRDTRIYTLVVGSKTSSVTYVDNYGAEVDLTQVVNPVYTRSVSVRKVVTGTSNALQGAVFSLHRELADGSMESAPMTGHERHVSGTDGTFSLGTLKQGTYYLVEESAPTGYNKLESPVRLTVPADDATAMTAIKVGSNTSLPVEGGTVTVPNSEGVVLPSTGGSGSAALQGTGVVLALCAVALTAGRQRARRGGDRP